MTAADQPLAYVDASALVKLVIEEDESAALSGYLDGGATWITSGVSRVEVVRAAGVASSDPVARIAAERIVSACMVVEVTHEVLRHAAELASPELRTLDAIHLASALRVSPDEVVAYDRRLLDAAALHGMEVTSPGT